MFGLNLSALLDSLDNVAKETLEEPKESATEIRSKRKASSKVDIITTEEPSSPDNKFGSVERPSSLPTAKGTLNDSSTHSYKTQESYVIPSLSTHGSQHESLDDVSSRERVNSVSSSTKAAPPPSTITLLPRLPSLPILQPPPVPPPPVTNPSPALSATIEQQVVEIAELKKQVKRQDKEIENLNQECLELEETTATLRQEVTAAWDQHRLAVERVNQLQSELAEEQRQSAKSLKKERTVAAQQLAIIEGKLEEQMNLFKASEKSRQMLDGEKVSLSSTISDHQAIVTSLEGELKARREAGIQLGVRHREELRQLSLAMDRLRVEHGEVIKANRQRQLQLEQEVTELTQSLASNSNSNANHTSSAKSSGDDRLRLEYDQLLKESLSLQQQVINLTATLEQERGHKLQIEGRLRQVMAMSEMDKGRLSSLESELKAASQQILTLTLQQLEINSNGKRSSSSHGFELLDQLSLSQQQQQQQDPNHSLKQQLDQVSKLLLKKQSELQEAILERSSLRARVSELTSRCSLQEQRISLLEEQVDSHMMLTMGDLEEGDIGGGVQTTAMTRRRGSNNITDTSSMPSTPSKSKMVTDLEKMGLRPPGSVTRTITLLDSFSLMAGRMFRVYPIARLGFVLYLMILHLWVIFILVLHMHDLELPDGPKDHISSMGLARRL